MHIAIQALWLIAAVAAAAGCSSTQAPGAEVRDVALGEVSDEAYVLNFDLTLSNPNSQPLELQDLYYTLSVDGEQVYEGRRSAESTVTADGAISITIPAVVQFDRVGHERVPGEIAYGLRGSLSYMTPDTIAEMLFDANIWRPSVSFGTEGRLTFEADPTAGRQ